VQTERYYQKCLKEELAQRLQKNASYSLRSFARSLQIDPTALSKILNGQKIPTPSLSKKILEQLPLSPKEQKLFLHSMAKAYEDEGVQRKKPEIKKILSQLNTHFPKHDLTVDYFRIISDWYNYAILQLVQTEGFQNDPRWIAKQLGIQEVEVKLAVERMKELEILKEEGGKLIRIPQGLTIKDKSITTPALRKRIKQITDKSVQSLENDPIEQRNHSTLTMAIDPEKIPLAKELIQTFMNQLADALQTNKKRVYELQVNLFPLQRSEK